ncbi:hypothetical protein ACWGII_06285 [Streptomyces sp. NPDC054855]
MDGMETTYNVKVYKILTYKGAKKTTYTVRWMVAGRRWRQPFDTVALADGFRSELIQATRKGGGVRRRDRAPGVPPVQVGRDELVQVRR